MKKRRTSRELALTLLYQLELNQESINPFTFEEFWKTNNYPFDIQKFTEKLVAFTINNKPELDKIISNSSENWAIERLGIIEKNILRFAVCEMLHFNDIPFNVTINEAIEIAKKFGDPESSKLINAILDKIKNDLPPK